MKKEFLTRMINLYGTEHPTVIQFAHLMEDENISDETLETLVEGHETLGICFEFEEEGEEEEDPYEWDGCEWADWDEETY